MQPALAIVYTYSHLVGGTGSERECGDSAALAFEEMAAHHCCKAHYAAGDIRSCSWATMSRETSRTLDSQRC